MIHDPALAAKSVRPGQLRNVAGVGDLASRYDGFLIDVWGVLTDGRDAYPEAVKTLCRLRKEGKPVVLVTNSSRRSREVEALLKGMGLNPSLWTGIISSGEMAFQVLSQPTAVTARATALYVLGHQPGSTWMHRLPIRTTHDVEAATLVLAVGLLEDSWTTHRELLQVLLRRKTPILCANPDVSVRVNGSHTPTVGSLAREYTLLGGQSRCLGKPFPTIYHLCRKLASRFGARRLLAIGDGWDTDVAGAAREGIDSLFVYGGDGGAGSSWEGEPGQDEPGWGGRSTFSPAPSQWAIRQLSW